MSVSVLFGARDLRPKTHINPMIRTAFGAGDAPFPVGTPLRPDTLRQGIVTRAQANVAARARVIGLSATPASADEPVRAQFCGPLTLTTEQWDNLTSETGGLVLGATYYLQAAFAPGRLTRTKPATPGNQVVRIGVALDARSMMLQVTAPTTVT